MDGSREPAAALERALRAEGMACRVEARERLAIMVPDTLPAPGAGIDLATRTVRERALALARAHGFTHVALELPASPASARAGLPGA
ncbi:MAG TPA: hypothetical protein VLE53_13665 [Gemmatimonadaceae bacterium]|nr:hypothetical protein [Gemmatimonadaceae bacterium]